MPTYGALYEKMLEDFKAWFDDAKNYLADGLQRGNDPLLPVLRNFIAEREVLEGYRVLIKDYSDADLKRLAKWFVVNKGITARRAAEIVEKLRTGISVLQGDLTIIASSKCITVEKFTSREEAESLCGFLKK